MNSPTIFPVGISSPWLELNATNIFAEHLKRWLLDSSSLTEKLISQCNDFSLTVIGQDCVSITEDEFQQVCGAGQTFIEEDWQVREVILWGDGKPWVFARSVIPMDLWQRDFANLSNTPLGQLIFNDTRFKRMPFQLTQMNNSGEFLKQLNLVGSPNLWGRRSSFTFEDLKMMVCEVFLPDCPAYQNMEPEINAK